MAGDDVDVSSLGEVKGFKFDVLAKRKPELIQEADWTFPGHFDAK